MSSSQPTVPPTCSSSEVQGKSYYVSYADTFVTFCYRIDLFTGGHFSVDYTSDDSSLCSAKDFNENSIISYYQSYSFQNVYFQDGTDGWKGNITIVEDTTITDVVLDILVYDSTLKEFEIKMFLPSCFSPSAIPTSMPSMLPSHSPVPSLSPSSIPSLSLTSLPSIQPSPMPTCSSDEFMGKTYFVTYTEQFINLCYKVELVSGGRLSYGVDNASCSEAGFSEQTFLSYYQSNSLSNVYFQDGSDGWSGTISVVEDSSITDMKFEISVYDQSAKRFEVNMVFPSCLSPSTMPSSQPI